MSSISAPRPFKALSERTRADYRAALAAIADLPTKVVDARTGEPARTGALPVCSLSQAAVDIIYERLRRDGAVTRQADYAIDVARRAWKVVRRKHPGLFLIPSPDPHGKTARFAVNPFEGVERVHYERDTAIPATRAEALVFAMAAFKAGPPRARRGGTDLFRVAPEAGGRAPGSHHLDGLSASHAPQQGAGIHHKTRKRVWKVLEVVDGRKRRLFYPELEDLLAQLPQLGVPMVMFVPQRGPRSKDTGLRTPRLYSEPYAQHLVQQFARMRACRRTSLLRRAATVA